METETELETGLSIETINMNLKKQKSSYNKDFFDLNQIFILIVSQKMENVFQNIFTLIKIAMTFPLTSNIDERSFSQMRIIKNYLRSTMSDNRLSNLAVIKINKDLEIDITKVVDKFASKKERKLDLLF